MTFMNLLRRSIGTARNKKKTTDVDGPPKSYSEGTDHPTSTNSADDENSIVEVKLLREWKEEDPVRIPAVSNITKYPVRLKPSSPSAVSNFPAGSNAVSEESELPQVKILNYKYGLSNSNADLLNEQEEEEETFGNKEKSIDSSRYSWSMSGMSSIEKNIIYRDAMPLKYEDDLSWMEQKSISFLPSIHTYKYHLLKDGEEEATFGKDEETIVKDRYSWIMSGIRSIDHKIANRNVKPLKDNPDSSMQESTPFITSCSFRTENERNGKKHKFDITARRLLRSSHSRCSNRCDLNMEHFPQASSDMIRTWQDTSLHHGAGSIAENEEFDLESNDYDYSHVSSITFKSSGCSSAEDYLEMKNSILRKETEGMFQHMDGHAEIPSLITTRKNEN